MNYKLDDEKIGSLIDQNGNEASVEVIATFLPKVVVESLLAALTRAELEMAALTLEPIAAINVLIPESMRRLNIALVDIGAGTSDIAITNKGSIVAYGMVPIAGDKITEVISDNYLLDFPIAEKVKRKIVLDGEAEIEDILGFTTIVAYDDLIKNTADSVSLLASELALEIMRLNQKAPSAVMLIGGGSLTPEIITTLANKLQLPENRVAVRGIEAIQSLNKNEDLPTGPDFVTPIGIAIVADQNPVHYITVNVNKKVIRMFEMKQLTIGDCLIQAGIEINKMYGKPGLASIIRIDDQVLTLPGEYGKSPLVYLNGIKTDVNKHVYNGDEIVVKTGSDGTEPIVTIQDIIGEDESLVVYFNNNEYELSTSYYVNNKRIDKSYIVKDNDLITTRDINSIQDFLTYIINRDLEEIKPISIFLNNKQVTLNTKETNILVNNQHEKLNYKVKHKDEIKLTLSEPPTVDDLLIQEELSYFHTAKVTFNNESIT